MNRLNSEDYIRAAYYLENEEGEAKPGRIAQRLGVSKNTVSAMVGKLARKNLLMHEKYGKVNLHGLKPHTIPTGVNTDAIICPVGWCAEASAQVVEVQ